MGRRPALTETDRAEAFKLLGAGMSGRKVAAKFGVDESTIRSLRGSVGHRPVPEIQVQTEVPVGLDDFETAQLKVYERIRLELEVGDHDARGLSALTKAMNDTIKAIRQHRVLSKTVEQEPEQKSQVAEMVLRRLQQLSRTKAPVVDAETPPQLDADADKAEAASG